MIKIVVFISNVNSFDFNFQPSEEVHNKIHERGFFCRILLLFLAFLNSLLNFFSSYLPLLAIFIPLLVSSLDLLLFPSLMCSEQIIHRINVIIVIQICCIILIMGDWLKLTSGLDTWDVFGPIIISRSSSVTFTASDQGFNILIYRVVIRRYLL